MRQKFWCNNFFYFNNKKLPKASRKKSKKIWQIIQNACETDAATAEQLLSAASLIPLDGRMNCIVDPITGEVFNIPNFCICDPLYKKIIKKDENFEETIIKIQLIYVFKNTNHVVQISNKITGIELKKIFCKLENAEYAKHQIRLLAKGQEIKDDLQVCYLGIKDEDKIQVSCRLLDENEI